MNRSVRYQSRPTGTVKTLRYSGVQGLDSVWPGTVDNSWTPAPDATPSGGPDGWQPATTGQIKDHPRGALYDNKNAGSGTGDYAITDDFKTYLMFNPGTPGSQWVPLQYITWGWNAAVAYQPDPANPTDPFVLVHAAKNGPTGPFNTSTHPMWDHNTADPGFGSGQGENDEVDDTDQTSPIIGD